MTTYRGKAVGIELWLASPEGGLLLVAKDKGVTVSQEATRRDEQDLRN